MKQNKRHKLWHGILRPPFIQVAFWVLGTISLLQLIAHQYVPVTIIDVIAPYGLVNYLSIFCFAIWFYSRQTHWLEQLKGLKSYPRLLNFSIWLFSLNLIVLMVSLFWLPLAVFQSSCFYAFTGLLGGIIVWTSQPKRLRSSAIKTRATTRLSLFISNHSTTISLIAIAVASIFIRCIRLGALGYSTDEGSAAIYSHYINQRGTPCSGDGVCYYTGPYFYIVSFFTWLFHNSEFWVRFPGILISSIALIVLFFLVKKLYESPQVALLVTILVAASDWFFVLGRYARGYSLIFLFITLTLLLYIKIFHDHKRIYFIPLLVCVALAFWTHQLSFIVLVLLLEPLYSRTYTRYTDKLFIFFGIFMIVGSYFALTKFSTHFGYLDSGYKGFADVLQGHTSLNKFWFLQQLQPPNWSYLKDLFKYFPQLAISVLLSIFLLLTKKKKNHVFLLAFVCGGLGIMAVYRIEYSLKYLWWFLPFFYATLVEFLLIIKARLRVAYYVILVALIACQVPGVVYVLGRHYGSNETRFPVLMNTHVESYYPDDKSPVEYLTKSYRSGDIIITDYFIQDIYLELLINRKSDYYVGTLSGQEFAEKYVTNKFYKESRDWRLSKKGPVITSSLREFKNILEAHHNSRIWYVSAADFVGRQHQNISNPEVNRFINQNLKDSLVYTGKDKNSKLYLIEQSPSLR